MNDKCMYINDKLCVCALHGFQSRHTLIVICDTNNAEHTSGFMEMCKALNNQERERVAPYGGLLGFLAGIHAVQPRPVMITRLCVCVNSFQQSLDMVWRVPTKTLC
jgi:hypothetical protein